MDDTCDLILPNRVSSVLLMLRIFRPVAVAAVLSPSEKIVRPLNLDHSPFFSRLHSLLYSWIYLQDQSPH